MVSEAVQLAERTIHRDVEALGAAGVPVYAERGRHGGIALLPGFRTDISGLTAPEARALFVFAGRGTLAGLGLEGDLRSALRKLLRSCPSRTGRGPSGRPAGWSSTPGRGCALARSCRTWRASRTQSGATAACGSAIGGPAPRRRPSASSTPTAWSPKAGTWYLVGADAGEPRLYRVSRIEAAEVTDEPADRPAELDLEALWEELRGRVEERGPGVEVEVRVRVERVQLLLRVVASQLLERVPPPQPSPYEGEGDSWVRLRLRYPALAAARASLLGFGPDVVVLEPDELRRDMLEAARALVAVYERDNRS